MLNQSPITSALALALFSLSTLAQTEPASATDSIGVDKTTIRIGGVMDLEGDSSALGQGMKAGLEAAFADQRINGRTIEFIVQNDFYTPQITSAATQQLVDQGVFAMVGNVGTPTAKVALPILAKHGVPAVGFFTGAGLLRPGVGDIINYRASYVQETAAVIDAAFNAGIKPEQVCAFVQNDAYGMAGISGIKAAFANYPAGQEMLPILDKIKAVTGANPPRNMMGPVGVYTRNTLFVRDGYESLKEWESTTNSACRLVVTVGTYAVISRFIGYAKSKGEDWLFSAVSFTGADHLRTSLSNYGVNSDVIVTEVTPALDSSLTIVAEAREQLGNALTHVSLEGFIVGKMFLAALANSAEPLTRQSFLEAVRGKTFKLGGANIDFGSDNQGSDLVNVTLLNGHQFEPVTAADLAERVLN